MGTWPAGAAHAHATSIAVALRRTAPRTVGDSVNRIELAHGELVTPDPDLAERSASSFDGQKGALQEMSVFLRTSGVPVVSRVAFAMARGFEYVKGLVELPIAWLGGNASGMRVSITDPDKISHRTVSMRENFAHYLRRAKQRAPAALAKRLSRGDVSPAEAEHDIHTLSLIPRRDFPQEENRHDAVDKWLRKHRYRR